MGDDDSGFSPAECSYDPIDVRADIIVYNGGADVIGPPGTGKSTLLKKVDHLWRKFYGGDTIINTAVTHVAARLLPRGQTLARVFHKNRYGNVRNVVVQLDESRTVGLAALARLATWGFVGAKFVMYGDPCQFEPIRDAWGGGNEPDIYRQMSRSLRVELSTNRRSTDQVLFDFHFKLRPYVLEDPYQVRLKEACVELYRKYPWDGVFPTWGFLCISHKTRQQVNDIINTETVKSLPGAVLVKTLGDIKGYYNQPQDMWLTPGMELLGVTKKSTLIINGVRYSVETVNTRMVTVRMLPEFHCHVPELPHDATDAMRKSHTAKLQAVAKVQGPIPLMHRDASAWLRLTHCLCYATVQGITIRDKHLVMLDVLKGHFSIRTLIVAASRVTDGPYLHAATEMQQRAFLRRFVPQAEMPDMPDEIDVHEDSESGDEYED